MSAMPSVEQRTGEESSGANVNTDIEVYMIGDNISEPVTPPDDEPRWAR